MQVLIFEQKAAASQFMQEYPSDLGGYVWGLGFYPVHFDGEVPEEYQSMVKVKQVEEN